MLITRLGCLLIGWLLCAGCAVATIVVGVVVDAGVGTVGIVQRDRQTDELIGLRAELAQFRQALTSQIKTSSERLREAQ